MHFDKQPYGLVELYVAASYASFTGNTTELRIALAVFTLAYILNLK